MTLFELGIGFTKLDADILKLTSRTGVLELLRVASGRYAPADVRNMTPYAKRQQRETHAELELRGLVELTGESKAAPVIPEILPHKVVNVPTYAPWTEMSLAELKVYIALFMAARHTRNPWFRFTGTHEELATTARLNRKAVGVALKELASRDLITMAQIRDGHRWTEGTSVQLKDPASGVSLNDLAWSFINGFRRLPSVDRYKLALRGIDPAINDLSGCTSGFKVYCPFCRSHEKRTLRINIDEDEDKWFCSACRKHGDSTALCAHRRFHLFRDVVPNPSRVEVMAASLPLPDTEVMTWIEEGESSAAISF